MPRDLTQEFHGDSAIIGCSCHLSLAEKISDITGKSHHREHSDENQFYSIDYERNDADYKVDVSSPEFKTSTTNRFNFIWTEFLPGNCYLTKEGDFDPKSNIANALKENGVMLINGALPKHLTSDDLPLRLYKMRMMFLLCLTRLPYRKKA